MRPARIGLALLTAVILASPLLMTASAAAHTTLISTTPPDGTAVAALPDQVTASFDSPLLDVGAGFVVRSADGTTVSAPQPTIDGGTLSVRIISDGPPGEYTAAFRVVSEDGHSVSDSFTFTVTGTGSPTASAGPPQSSLASAAPSASPPASPTPVPAPGGSPMLVAGLAAVGVAGLALIVVAARRRGGPSSRDEPTPDR